MIQNPGLQLFTFEIASSEDLLYIPLCVRFHLDRTGKRISLAEWQQLPHDVRTELASVPVPSTTADDDFTACLDAAMLTHIGHPAEHSSPASVSGTPDSEKGDVPEALARQCLLAGLPVPDDAQWQMLSLFQRYALTKLSRKETLNHDFIPAMQAFRLAAE